MNTNHPAHALSTALAAVVLTAVQGCGTEVATTPEDISDLVETSQPAPAKDRGEPLVDLPQRGLGAEGWR